MGSNNNNNVWSRGLVKEELKDLNYRFAAYLDRVRGLRESGGQVDTSAFLKSVKILEDELLNLRNMYEKELDNLRRQQEESCKEKNHFQHLSEKNSHLAQQLQERVTAEVDKNRRQMDEMNLLQRALAQKESELKEARIAMKGPLDELEYKQRDHESLMREFDTLKRRCDHEQQAFQEADNKTQQLQQQLDFQVQVADKQARDMKERLDAAANTILALEAKIRELSKSDSSLVENLRRVREAAEEDLLKYREESFAEYSRNLSTVKVQMEKDAKQIDDLRKENATLNAMIDDLTAKLAHVQGQVSGLVHEKNAAEEALSLERTRAREQVQNLQSKLGEMQSELMLKMKQASSNLDSQIPLKTEIESMKVLLAEEEKRLFGSSSGVQNVGLSTSPTYGNKSYGVGGGSSNMLEGISRMNTINYPPVNQTSSYATAPPPPLPQYIPGPSAPAYNSYENEECPVPKPLMPVSLHQVHSDIAKLRNLEKAVQEAAGREDENNYGCKSPSAVGPVRAKSAPAPGSGEDRASSNVERSQSATSHDYNTATSSSTEDIRILEIHPKGKFIRLHNTNTEKEFEFGNFLLQQNCGGRTVAVYRFPPRLKCAPGGTVTVWAGTVDPLMHQPPTDFVFQEQKRWGTGPECTTIFSRANGQAIAWMTAAHRFVKDAYDTTASSSQIGENVTDDWKEDSKDQMPELPAEQKQEQVFLRREKMEQPSLNPNKHPHGMDPATPTHPVTGVERPLTMGNDNSSLCRQSRSQSTRPDPIAGQPYAGASAHRMGSAPLKKYVMTNTTIRGNGALANKSAGEIRYGQPSPFLSPLQQDFAKSRGAKQSSITRLTPN